MQYLLLPLLLDFLSASPSLQDGLLAPKTTADPASHYGLAPIPTEGPKELKARADFVSPNICGWFSGSDSDVRWSYYNTQITCFWNSDAKIVGNASPAQTRCVDSTALSAETCSTCSGKIVECSSSALPYCATFFYGTDYHAYLCTNQPDVSYHMEPTWNGMADPIAFPVYTGAKGISTGTQYPPGYPIPTSSDTPPAKSDSPSSPASSPPSNSNPTSSSTSNSKPVPVGAIVGGVVGGLAVIAIAAAAVIIFLIRSSRKRRNNSAYPSQHQPPMAPLPQQQIFPKPEIDSRPITQPYYPPPQQNQYAPMPVPTPVSMPTPTPPPATSLELDPNSTSQPHQPGLVSNQEPPQLKYSGTVHEAP